MQGIGRPGLDARRGGQPRFHVMSYDRIDWHLDSAIEAGQPEEHAFTHIGLYLAWLIRRDLHDPRIFPPDHVAAVRAGEMTGSDLADDIDGKLTSADMNAEGAAFSDARYDAYIREYGTLFDRSSDYGVSDGPEEYQTVERLLDRMYAEWAADGRPGPPAKPEREVPDHDFVPTAGYLLVPTDFSQEQIDELVGRTPFPVDVMSPERLPPTPHVAPQLELLIPPAFAGREIETFSIRASKWGSSLLKRALKRLGVAPKDAVVASGMGGSGQGTLSVMIYGVPAIDAERLTSEFQSVIFRLPGSTWEPRVIADREVQWASGVEFTAAFWARDGMIVHVAGQPGIVESAISRLP